MKDDAFAHRHALVRTLLLLHIPGVAVLGYLNNFKVSDLIMALVPLALAWVVAGIGTPQRRATAASAGLGIASLLVVLLSRGSTEAHFHIFVIIGFVSIYQNWVAFASVVVLTLGSEAAFTAHDPTLIFDHRAAQNSPWLWTAIHTAFVLAECIAMMIFWKSTEAESRRATRMASELSMAEVQRTREQADQRQASSDLMTNLARRNQSLLNRQLTRIDQLEKDEDDPEVLAHLFTLDHLATRMRRNAESLLVLSGQEPQRRFGAPVPLSDVTRGAIAEVEDYTRADVALAVDVLVDGHAVGDMVHLIAELIENAATFSPPSSRVVVSGVPQHDSSYVVTVDDGGIGMSDSDLAAAKVALSEEASANVELSGQLGFHVIARLAARHGVSVSIARAAGIGATGLRATVHLPAALVSGLPVDLGVGMVAAELPAWPSAEVAVEAAPLDAGLLTAAAPFIDAPIFEPVAVFEPEPLPVFEPEPAVVSYEPAPAVVSYEPEPVLAAVTSSTAAAVDVTASGLTRRVPNASLNPNLSSSSDAAPASEAPAADPDRARSSLDAFYGGLNRGSSNVEGDDV